MGFEILTSFTKEKTNSGLLMLCSVVEIYQSNEVLVIYLVSQRLAFYKDYLFYFHLHNQISLMQIRPDRLQQCFPEASTNEINYVYETLNNSES